jgi:hypothetical protein
MAKMKLRKAKGKSGGSNSGGGNRKKRDKVCYHGYHVSWTRSRRIGGPTMSRPTWPKGMGQEAHNRGSLEDNHRIKSCN